MKKPLLPTSDLAKRLGAVMHRRPKTPWLPREVSAFRMIQGHVTDDDMAMLERYYASNWPPESNKNHLRHDLVTLLNNAFGEVDRARIWCEKHPLRRERKIIPMPPVQSEQPAVVGDPAEVQRFLEEYRKRKATRGSTA